MANKQTGTVLHYLRTIASPPDWTDAQLLERYGATSGEEAFAALVRRHGPMVLGVCQRVLQDWHEAEDAFQATFLVLARRAGQLDQPELLGHWLYRVAYRTAGKAKAARIRRRAVERQQVPSPDSTSSDDPLWRDLRPILDEAVNGLPQKYRAPFVLCYLEGKTNDEAARVLGCPRGTIATRLARARERLRTQLSRRGLTLSSGILATLLGANRLSAGVQTPLMLSTIKGVLLAMAGKAAVTGALPGAVLVLAEGVIRSMRMTRLRLATGLLSGLCVLGAGAGMLAQQSPPAASAVRKNQDAPTGQLADQARADQERLQGTWVVIDAEESGKKIDVKKWATVQLIVADNDMIFLSPNGEEDWAESHTYKLDPTRQPATIELNGYADPVPASILLRGAADRGLQPPRRARPAEETLLGIYRLENNKLVICLDIGKSGKRPTDFVTHPGDETHRMVFKRIGPAQEAVIEGELLSHWIDALRNRDLRAAEVLILSSRKRPGAIVPAVLKVFQDKEASTQALAAEALAAAGPWAKTAVPALRAALQDRDSSTRLWAAYALTKIETDYAEHIAFLIAAVDDPDLKLRQQAVEILGKIGMEAAAAVPALLKVLDEQGQGDMARLRGLRSDAAMALGAIGPQAALAVPALIAALDEPGIDQSAARGLGGIGPSARPAIPRLRAALKDRNAAFRVCAAAALIRIEQTNNQEAFAVLRQALQEDSELVRASAANELIMLAPTGPQANVPIFIEMLQHEDKNVRLSAIEGLRLVSPMAKDAIPALTKALSDDDQGVREAVQRALKAIERHAMRP
jgi:RNA polymerase sigma factor (sigma-70 family)